jgi:hypothetical protein
MALPPPTTYGWRAFAKAKEKRDSLKRRTRRLATKEGNDKFLGAKDLSTTTYHY